jgi:threonine aldolase
MAKTKIWMLFDGRYRTDEDKAVCYEVCETLKEAKENANNYGNDTVIVEAEEENNIISGSKIVN